MSSTLRTLVPLPHDKYRTGERGAGAAMARLASSAQALHEVITGVPPAGDGAPIHAPHDHCYIGVPLPRGCQYYFDCGEQVDEWSWANGTTTEWWRYYNGSQVISYNPATSARYYDDPADIHAYATPNVDSENTAISGNPCYLVADLLVWTDNDCEFRFYNIDRDEVSATVNLVGAAVTAAPPQEITCYIPVTGGRVNQYYPEFQCSTVNNIVTIAQLGIYETYAISQPKSVGTELYNTVTRP